MKFKTFLLTFSAFTAFASTLAHAQVAPSTTGPAGHDIGPVGLDLRFLKDVGKFLGKRVLTVYGGTQYFQDYFSAHPNETTYQGFIGMEGAVSMGSTGELGQNREKITGRNAGGMLVPFQVEVNQSGNYMVSVAVAEWKNMTAAHRGAFWKSVNNITIFRYEISNLVPGVKQDQFTIAEIEPRVSLYGAKKESYLALSGKFAGGYNQNTYQLTDAEKIQFQSWYGRVKFGFDLTLKLSPRLKFNGSAKYVYQGSINNLVGGSDKVILTDATGTATDTKGVGGSYSGILAQGEFSYGFKTKTGNQRRAGIFWEGNFNADNSVVILDQNRTTIGLVNPLLNRGGLRLTF